MTDFICRKTMVRCQTPGMCSPHGGCQPSVLIETNVRYSSGTAPALQETPAILVEAKRLSGLALDWAVAVAQVAAGVITADAGEHSTGRLYFNVKFGKPSLWGAGKEAKGTHNVETGKPWVHHGPGGDYSPSTNWRQGGPLIDQYEISVQCFDASSPGDLKWCAYTPDNMPLSSGDEITGSTALIAACRALVHLKLGEVVRVPTDLVEGRP